MLFVGDDASSPDIAASMLRRLVGDRVEIRTAGAQRPDPGGRGDDILVQMGLNPASEERLSAQALNVADHVVVLGTHLDVARVAGRTYEEWDVEQDDLAGRVRRLAVDLLGGTEDEPFRRSRVRRVLAWARRRRVVVALARGLRRLRSRTP
ncbi:Protein-tyrosine-phosphatase [Microlunatus flavus]|uniref:Protein-tyrosine-phosphatase n=1 Tax=Microlunatus flavus TaxID=1036181 RepID=A0A1H9L4W1_9ACTN|nr:Protein-tyrosine-phosphatase [Microlunatus flavus]